MDQDDFDRGELTLSLMFEPTSEPSQNPKGTLHVRVRQAHNLPPMNSSNLTDAVAKCYLLPDRSSSSKRKTGVVKNNLSPVWEESFVYKHLSLRELLEERVLEVTVWDHRSRQGNIFVGGLRVGGAPGRAGRHREWMDCIGAEVSQWEEVLSQPGRWVEHRHTLRTSMAPRDVDLSGTLPPFKMPSLSADVPTDAAAAAAAELQKPVLQSLTEATPTPAVPVVQLDEETPSTNNLPPKVPSTIVTPSDPPAVHSSPPHAPPPGAEPGPGLEREPEEEEKKEEEEPRYKPQVCAKYVNGDLMWYRIRLLVERERRREFSDYK